MPNTSKGKSIRQLIAELQSFEDQGLEVRLSTDGGRTDHPIDLVVRDGGNCVLWTWDPASARDRPPAG